MARFAGAVHVVTTDGKAGRRGVTATAVTSVSDSPPLLLFCLNRNREENRWFIENGVFALNTLCVDQSEIARAFAGEGQLSMDERFRVGAWQQLKTGAPVLGGARMSLDCVVTDVQAIATHYVIFGRVVDFARDGHGDALIYLDRDYRKLEGERGES